MNIQSEEALEKDLVAKLGTLGYSFVEITDERKLLRNLKMQLERHNKTIFSDGEFEKILNHLNKGSVFERAKTLRGKFYLKRDDGDDFHVEFLNQEHWCQNQYQVTRQVTMEGSYKNRYDVTLLINGLPLVQIELKRRGMEIKEAFNQIQRYQDHSFWASYGLFRYVQLFVISNGVNTKYYANNKTAGFKQTFFWADEKNNLIKNLDDFAQAFLEKCHLSKMICKYIVLHESDNLLMVLRPYQYYAVEAIIDKVKTSSKNGYIWHTTGSGKTLTSFKAAQIIQSLPKVDKVVFVVDRSDLDYQTTKEFNNFKEGCVDGTADTKSLIKQFEDDSNSLIITTIQKLNTAISKTNYLKRMEKLKDKKIVFIFDECHRSQFGDTHKRITNFFENYQMFGFTGTPIFADNSTSNALGQRTTKDLFDKCLHKYVITNAIKDQNVLKFSVEYWGKLKQKDGNTNDDKVKGIDKKGFFENPKRLELITDWIIQNHNRKTHDRDFSAIFCVSGVDALIKYYDLFQGKKKEGLHDLRVVTIFTYGANEEDKEADGLIEEVELDLPKAINPDTMRSREKLDLYIEDYNKMFNTKFSTKDNKGFYAYYKDIAKRVKGRDKKAALDKDRVDILLVVNMFLTGFDAKKVNTLYVDKNLKYHGLIQAYSRTNRILNEKKSHGNIICFRNLKDETDEAIKLFSNEDAKEEIFIEPYSYYIELFNKGVQLLKNVADSPSAVDNLPSEKEELAFVQAFRYLMRTRNVMKGFSEFTFEDLDITEQEFEDYKSKYLDIYDKTHSNEGNEGTESIIEDVDFALELIHKDEVNVAYIIELLADIYSQEDDDLTEQGGETKEKKIQDIINLLGKEVTLRSKRILIEQFIKEYMPNLEKGADVRLAFKDYWNEQKKENLIALCKNEGLKEDKLIELIEEYLFTGKEPLSNSISDSLIEQPKIMERKSIIDSVKDKILNFVRTFDDDMGDV
ncbi:MAG: restriction endonuclease subunit R [Rickettsiales bacterium]|nr:restriction endonuclease subunit R [Rickettsiales bacterium]